MTIQGIPNIKGHPPREVLGCKTINSTRYSHESTKITTSYKMPFGLNVDLYRLGVRLGFP
jgi:hypothetical protein